MRTLRLRAASMAWADRMPSPALVRELAIVQRTRRAASFRPSSRRARGPARVPIRDPPAPAGRRSRPGSSWRPSCRPASSPSCSARSRRAALRKDTLCRGGRGGRARGTSGRTPPGRRVPAAARRSPLPATELLADHGRDKVVLGVEVGVEGSVGQSGIAHQGRDADPSMPSCLNRRPAVSMIRLRVASLCSLSYRATALLLFASMRAQAGREAIVGRSTSNLRTTGQKDSRASWSRTASLRRATAISSRPGWRGSGPRPGRSGIARRTSAPARRMWLGFDTRPIASRCLVGWPRVKHP